ncbi:MAG: hypothetical protein QOD84_1988 [Acidobacteriaceae bacterium]|jgi:hypothetical protein
MNYVFRPTGREPWRALVQAAVLESDIERIPQRVLIAQAAVIKEIEHGLHSDGAEHWALLEALNTLRELHNMAEDRALKRDQALPDG